ncbi:MAG TPA: hypothetical protein VKQ11_19790 [Candidatus Sulfotelmatobacter sp.]|nr:hypothetical protein [Candidatus Sulfotelmatobacter sp.]
MAIAIFSKFSNACGPFVYSGCFMFMDYIKQLRRNLHRLATKYKNQIDHKHRASDAATEVHYSTPVINELHVSDATIDRLKRKSREENKAEKRRDRIQAWGLFIVVIYAGFTFMQWWELNTANINQSAATINTAVTADRALQISKKSSDLAAAAFHSEQRAWLKTNFEITSIEPTLSHHLQEPLTITNIGRTPAHKIRGAIYLEFVDVDKSPNLARAIERVSHPVVAKQGSEGHGAWVDIGLLFPDDPRSLNIVGENVSSNRYVQYPNSTYIALYGVVTYYDVFERHHWIHFCSMRPNLYAGSLQDPKKLCSDFNDVDRDIE